MIVARTLSELRGVQARLGSPALVPTMGALHDGHLALVAAAKRSGLNVVASIFVNPMQFGPGEDFSRYPRNEEADLAKLEAAGCALAWLPDVATMYPPGDATAISVCGPAENFEGAVRPGHFRGVATVVAKLFGQIRPECAYFGEKDWQQLQVVRRMVADLLLPVRIEVVETRREPDGLALSSRNLYLNPAQRAAAPVLYQTLTALRAALHGGATPRPAIDAAIERLEEAGFVPDYCVLVNAETLEPIETVRPPSRLLVAARLDGIRLLDTVGVN